MTTPTLKEYLQNLDNKSDSNVKTTLELFCDHMDNKYDQGYEDGYNSGKKEGHLEMMHLLRDLNDSQISTVKQVVRSSYFAGLEAK